MKHWIIVLRLVAMTVLEKILKARFVIESVTSSGYFSDPAEILGNVATAADELELAVQAAESGGKDETGEMHQKEFLLEVALNISKNLVENVANTDNDIGDIIAFSAGMDVKGQGGMSPRIFKVVNTALSGRVKLETVSEKRAAYIWEYSTSPEDGASWVTGITTTVAAAVIEGLTPGTKYWFRVAVVLDEQGPWQGPLHAIVT